MGIKLGIIGKLSWAIVIGITCLILEINVCVLQQKGLKKIVCLAVLLEQLLLQQTVRHFLDNECPPTRLREIFDGKDGREQGIAGCFNECPRIAMADEGERVRQFWLTNPWDGTLPEQRV